MLRTAVCVPVLSLYHSQRTSTPRVCMSISVGNRIDGIFLFCIETHRSVLFVVTPSSCCSYNVQSERLLKVSACALFLGRASTRSRPYKPTTSRIAQLRTSSAGDDANHFIPYYLTTTTPPCTNFHRISSSGLRFALRAETGAPW